MWTLALLGALVAVLAPTARLIWLHDHGGAHRLNRARRVTVQVWGQR